MAPNHRFPGLSVGTDLPYETKLVAKKGKLWPWILAGTLLNVCITSVVIGLTVYCVHTELQTVRVSPWMWEADSITSAELKTSRISFGS